MRNKVEMAGIYESAKKNSDVLAVLCIIEDVSFSSDELKYPSMQAAHAMRTLLKQGNTRALRMFGFGDPAKLLINEVCSNLRDL